MSFSTHYILLSFTLLFSISLTIPVDEPALESLKASRPSNGEIFAYPPNAPTIHGIANTVSPQLEVRRPTTSFPLRKREGVAREVTNCPLGFDYLESACNGARNMGNYVVWCRKTANPLLHNYQPGTAYVFSGACQPGEVCIDNTPDDPPFPPLVAFCLSDTAWELYPISETTLPWHMVTGASIVGLPSANAGALGYTLEALLTDASKQNSINASSMQIQAQRQLNVHGHWIPQTLPGGTAKCTNCDSISLHPVPDGTQSISVDLALEEAGNLYLGSFVS